jgi:predicted Zn-dependent protease
VTDDIATFHLPALERAVAELERLGGRYEAFARVGTVEEHRWRASFGWERRRTREAGVACRVATEGTCAFAAAAGSAASAGREAARAAHDGLAPAPDPIPPFDRLGVVEVAAPSTPPDAKEVMSFADALVSRLTSTSAAATPAEIRVQAGASRSIILTAEGFSARAAATGVVVEVVALDGGAPRLFQAASNSLAQLDLKSLAERALEVTSLASRGVAPARQLADVLLAPAVAARLLAAVTPAITRAGSRLRSLLAAVSPVWELWDLRPGPEGLVAMAWDGEGFPARPLPLLSRGRLGDPLAAWSDAQRWTVPAGGAVRASYREPPSAAPANLVVRANPPTRAADLLERLTDGFYLALPLGDPQLDPSSGRFSLAATALGIADGRVVSSHPGVELRGSVGRLLRNLEATGGDSASFSLTCAVTTPSLLVRGLEIA